MKSVTLTSALLLLSASAVAPRASAAGDVCATAYEHSQELRADKDLVGAREQLLQCSQAGCAEFIRKDCGQWLGEVETALPTVAVIAQDGKGQPLTAVQITVDGSVIAAALDGRALPLNPGKHHFRFDAAGFQPLERDALIVEGQKAQPIALSFEPLVATPLSPPAPLAPEPGPRVTAPVIALGALGVAGLATFAGFALTGLSQEHELRDQPCAGTHTCTDSQLSPIKHKYLIADISLGVGVVSLAAATYFLLSPPKPTASASTAPRLDVNAGASWLMASLSARY